MGRFMQRELSSQWLERLGINYKNKVCPLRGEMDILRAKSDPSHIYDGKFATPQLRMLIDYFGSAYKNDERLLDMILDGIITVSAGHDLQNVIFRANGADILMLEAYHGGFDAKFCVMMIILDGVVVFCGVADRQLRIRYNTLSGTYGSVGMASILNGYRADQGDNDTMSGGTTLVPYIEKGTLLPICDSAALSINGESWANDSEVLKLARTFVTVNFGEATFAVTLNGKKCRFDCAVMIPSANFADGSGKVYLMQKTSTNTKSRKSEMKYTVDYIMSRDNFIRLLGSSQGYKRELATAMRICSIDLSVVGMKEKLISDADLIPVVKRYSTFGKSRDVAIKLALDTLGHKFDDNLFKSLLKKSLQAKDNKYSDIYDTNLALTIMKGNQSIKHRVSDLTHGGKDANVFVLMDKTTGAREAWSVGQGIVWQTILNIAKNAGSELNTNTPYEYGESKPESTVVFTKSVHLRTSGDYYGYNKKNIDHACYYRVQMDEFGQLRLKIILDSKYLYRCHVQSPIIYIKDKGSVWNAIAAIENAIALYLMPSLEHNDEDAIKVFFKALNGIGGWLRAGVQSKQEILYQLKDFLCYNNTIRGFNEYFACELLNYVGIPSMCKYKEDTIQYMVESLDSIASTKYEDDFDDDMVDDMAEDMAGADSSDDLDDLDDLIGAEMFDSDDEDTSDDEFGDFGGSTGDTGSVADDTEEDEFAGFGGGDAPSNTSSVSAESDDLDDLEDLVDAEMEEDYEDYDSYDEDDSYEEVESEGEDEFGGFGGESDSTAEQYDYSSVDLSDTSLGVMLDEKGKQRTWIEVMQKWCLSQDAEEFKMVACDPDTLKEIWQDDYVQLGGDAAGVQNKLMIFWKAVKEELK